jgi:hypothetical protein
MTEERSHYCVRCRLDGVERFFIWYSDECDGVLLSSPKQIALFPCLPELERYAADQNIELDAEAAAIYDFDRLAQWLVHPTSETPDCHFLLNAWNMLGDIAYSVGVSVAEPSEANTVYDKLFWGCNLPSATPPGMQFEPNWSIDDISILSAVLSSGLNVLRRAVGHAA